MTDAQIEAAARAMCVAEGVDPEWPCPGIGNLIPVGETWLAWQVRVPKARAALEAAEALAWQPIAKAPDDRQVAIWCPAREGLDELMTFARHHPDAGFCVDELREPTHFRIVEPPR